MKQDLEITASNAKLLSLIEHPVWSEFVRIVDEDMKMLDNISSLYVEAKRDELIREIEVRYHVIHKIRDYIASTIERAETALKDQEDYKSDVVTFHDTTDL